MGIKKAKELAGDADFLLCVFDAFDAKAGHNRHISAVKEVEQIVAERREKNKRQSTSGDCDVLIA